MCDTAKYMACLLFLFAAICVEAKPCITHPKRGNITYYRNKFLFVRDHAPKPQGASGSPSQAGAATQGTPGTKKCPWTWDINTDTARRPVVIAVAKCQNCDVTTKCRQVTYRHSVLIQRKDCRTGEMVWSWRLKELPIAYVYDI
ncbi:uncharacterized protein LOC111338127 [Paramuricea clavata]|uniref:Uncharacterized protein LOC111338127 n=1 Tax=Paramuricea clavata TaxID=317549 RepID=A0A6S7GGA8_PARCT|nr:uncharacterized protein LOC111338127 [Paramuricea clavata]